MADMEPPVGSPTRGPRRHLFGYYDKCPWDSTARYALALEAGFAGRPPGLQDRAVLGMRGATAEPRTEESQADFYQRQFAVVSHFSSVIGTSPWVLYDFRSPLRQNKYQRGYNLKGLIADDHRSRKLAFATVREVYEDMHRMPQ
jgi:hypothetical protein